VRVREREREREREGQIDSAKERTGETDTHTRPLVIPTRKENDRAQRERELRGSSVPGRERGRRGSRGRGKRVNRESTCKQATRETNNVETAGCSPSNEARQAGGRQASGRTNGRTDGQTDRQTETGRQAGRQAGRPTFARFVLRAPFSVRALVRTAR